jgi:hypothetical protein
VGTISVIGKAYARLDELPAGIRDRIDLLGDHRDGLGEIDPLGWTEQEWRQRRETDPFGSLLAREGIEVSSR